MSKKKIVLISVGAAVLIAACILVFVFFNSRNVGKNDDLTFNLGDNIGSTDLKEAKLTFYFEAGEAKDKRNVLDQVERKAGKKLNVKLDFKSIPAYPDGYLSQLKGLIASGEPCDAFYFSNQLPGGLKALVNENVIKDISKLFPQYAPNYYQKFSKEEIALASVDGKIYAVPNHVPFAETRCAIVREDLMKKYNISDIKNYDDYEAFLKAVKQNGKDIVPMTHHESSIGLFAESYGYVILDYQHGLVYKWDDPDMKIMAWEQTPEFKKGIEKINDWYTKGYLSKDSPSVEVDANAILSGKWASVVASFGNQLDYNSSLKSNNSSLSYKAYPLSQNKVVVRAPQLYGAMVVTAASSNAERALMFINWLQSNQENYDSLMYGVKGKNYTLVNDKVATPDDKNKGESYNSWGWRWPFENIDYERVSVYDPADTIKEYYKTIKEKAKYPPHTGFVPDYTAVEDTANYRETTFYSLDQEIYRGSFKPEDINAYISDQKTNGADNLVAEVQKQLDKWKAQNK